MDKRVKLALVVCLLMAMFSTAPRPAAAETSSLLSPYWGTTITQWDDLIVRYSGQRGIDPDLIASIIFEESHGFPNQISFAGAVGLMQIMPQEAGFSWRPTRDELLLPAANLSWGTRTFSQVMQQAEGSMSRALAAYNGGWGQVDYRGPKAFAGRVIDHYARAIAARAGYDAKSMKAWSLVLDVRSSSGLARIDLVRSDGTTEANAEFDLARLPDSAPHATAFSAIGKSNTAWFIEAWVIVEPAEGRTINPERGSY
jgi:hypothetical protein